MGDRLDLISWNAWGDATRWGDILDNNSWLPMQREYPEGLKLVLPVDDVAEDLTIEATNNLPPWKQ